MSSKIIFESKQIETVKKRIIHIVMMYSFALFLIIKLTTVFSFGWFLMVTLLITSLYLEIISKRGRSVNRIIIEPSHTQITFEYIGGLVSKGTIISNLEKITYNYEPKFYSGLKTPMTLSFYDSGIFVCGIQLSKEWDNNKIVKICKMIDDCKQS